MFINDRTIRISTGASRKSMSWQQQELLWSDFVRRVSMPVRTRESYEEYRGFSKSGQDSLKDIGGFVGGELTGKARRSQNAGPRHLVTLDADNIPAGGTQRVLTVLDSMGCAYAVYSTRKHEPAAPRLRIIFPLDEPCSVEEYEPIARKAASFLGMPKIGRAHV